MTRANDDDAIYEEGHGVGYNLGHRDGHASRNLEMSMHVATILRQGKEIDRLKAEISKLEDLRDYYCRGIATLMDDARALKIAHETRGAR